MRTKLPALLAATALISSSAGAVRAQVGEVSAAFSATTLDLSAYGDARIAPDMATLSLGVETTEAGAAAALSANASRMSRLISALRTVGVAERDLQTANIGLSPQYVYQDGRPPRLTGYQASNQLTVTIRSLPQLGAAIDAVAGVGVSNIGQIALGLTNPAAIENTARIAAVKALEDKAALYAQAAGYRVGRLVSLSEVGGYTPSPRQPTPMMAMSMKSAAPTPVEAGELNVRIDVRGVFELTK